MLETDRRTFIKGLLIAAGATVTSSKFVNAGIPVNDIVENFDRTGVWISSYGENKPKYIGVPTCIMYSSPKLIKLPYTMDISSLDISIASDIDGYNTLYEHAMKNVRMANNPYSQLIIKAPFNQNRLITYDIRKAFITSLDDVTLNDGGLMLLNVSLYLSESITLKQLNVEII